MAVPIVSIQYFYTDIYCWYFIFIGGVIMNIKMKYFLNKKLCKQSMRTFEGISNGRKKALDNWFLDKWAQIDSIKNSLTALNDNEDIVNKYLEKLV